MAVYDSTCRIYTDDCPENGERKRRPIYKHQQNIKTNEGLSNMFKLYPNAATSVINIQFLGHSLKKLAVYNVLGELIIEIDELKNNEIDVSKLLSGLYFLKAYDETGHLGFAKFIKQ